ncbi:MAG: hypothetical protein AMJ53_00675 [Gammaproteobacteria bacterium SG8_11]|nr:MAG: hypothetical protein AMJ53_00675 [Gammaproteobacteria bacterium SG8_11]
MKTEALLENEFHHDGRGPELQRTVWVHNGVILKGFEYYNPEDVYEEENIKHLELIGLEAYSMAGEEVHGNILAAGESRAAVLKVENSPWLKQFNPSHLDQCDHYQIMFYDEIYDVICKEIKAGKGRLTDGGV